MVSTLSRQEKFNQVRRNFCFYLDIQEHGLARTISRRLQDMGLQQEVVLSARVTHVVRGARGAAPCRREGRSRADAMLERARCTPTPQRYVLLSVEKAISLLDKLYDTFFTAPRKAKVRLFSKPFIKIEFLDKKCRPLYKEFDEWPEISLEPEPAGPGAARDDRPNATQNPDMTRKNRPRIKEKEKEEEARGGWCEACGAAYAARAAHLRSARHAAFARHAGNYRALDALIRPNGLNGHPRRSRRTPVDGPPYYKVVGVSTKLRSSGGFAPKPKEASPPCNGAEPLVVKFRKVRRSELSVLSDEAEQFMFPRRASSGSSSSDEEENGKRASPPPALERRRQARPIALKEESSEEDSWLDDSRHRKRRVAPVARKSRRAPGRPPAPEPPPEPAEPVLAKLKLEPEPELVPEPKLEPEPEPEAAEAPGAERVESCMKWVDGRLTYPPAVERLQFAFESAPRSEPWYHAFARQDEGRAAVRDVPRCFSLYSNSPKLPYEMSQLPPLKPNCCALSSLPRRLAAGGPGAARGLRSRPAAAARPRQSPREHASTRAMLGSAGLRRADDARSTASDDTAEREPAPSTAQRAAARLHQFFAEVFDGDDEPPEPGAGAALAARAPPDVLALVAGGDACDAIRRELAAVADVPDAPRARRRGRFKKNRTGWPRKKPKKDSRAGSSDERKTSSSAERSSAGSPSAGSEGERPAADKALRLQVQVLLEDEKAAAEERRRRPLALGALGWLQPVVRVARVVPAAPRRLRSQARPRPR